MHAFRLTHQREVVARERLLGAAGRSAEPHKWLPLEAGRANEPLLPDHIPLIEQWVEALS